MRLASRPLAIFLELTQNCDLSCPMCRFGEKYNPAWNMPLDMFQRIAGLELAGLHVFEAEATAPESARQAARRPGCGGLPRIILTSHDKRTTR